MTDTFPALLQTAATRWPDRCAFRCDDAELSFAGLRAAAGQMANVLVDAGVSEGACVGIMLPRSLQTPTAFYGVLLAGGVCVPLDPQAPAGHIAEVIEDCGIEVLIGGSSRRALRKVTRSAGAGLVVVSDVAEPLPQVARQFTWDDVATAPERWPLSATAAQPGDLAYLMFTSGSTGKPKGIMHTHASGLAYARLAVATYAVQPHDRIASFAPLHVDQCTFALFCGLLSGATVVIVPEAIVAFPIDLAELIERERISIWYSVPLPLVMLLEQGELQGHDHGELRWVKYGGEPFPPRQLRALAALWPNARLSNVYGPAEVNQCTWFHVTQDALDSDEPVPIGQVWAETDVMLVDEHDRGVPDGEPGELLVHSSTMMRGYWRRPDLDARVFLDQQTGDGVRRYYRTGDIMRRDSQGLLHFMGRKDRQVKVRGRRVELEAVEAAFAALEPVSEAAAFVAGEHAHSQTIIAVVSLVTASEPPGDLLRLVRDVLPTYAQPAEVHVVAEFPRTGAGKIDRNALARAHAGGRALDSVSSRQATPQ